jgi:hypothetical protein
MKQRKKTVSANAIAMARSITLGARSVENQGN